MRHDQGVKGHLTLLHQWQKHVGKHDECLLQLGVGVRQARLRPGGGAGSTGGGRGAWLCQFGTPAGVEEGHGHREGKVRQLGQVPLGLRVYQKDGISL